MGKFSQFLVFAAIMGLLIFAIIMRFDRIGHRSIHHDESLHALYGKYFHDSPKTHYYKYDPLLHGPLLYHLIPYAYHVGGQSLESARMISVIFGLFLVLTPFFFRHLYSSFTLWTLVLYGALSPTLIYWSRFLREDILILFCMSFLLIGITLIKKPLWKILSISVAFGLIFCTKENYFITLVLLLVYLLFEFVFLAFIKNSNSSLLSKLFLFLRHNWLGSLLGILLCTLIISYFYSAGFQYTQGIKDFFFAKGFQYWIGQHHHERLTGPFSFHVLLLSWYEFPIVFLWLFLICYFFIQFPLAMSIISLVSFGMALTTYLLCHNFENINQWVGTYLKLKTSLDFPVFFGSLSMGLTGTLYFLGHNKRAHAFFFYFACSTLFAYSYAGEKVPWLSLYPFIASLAFFAVWSRDFNLNFSFLSSGTTFLLILITGAMLGTQTVLSYYVNFSRAGAQEELLSQVHTTPQYEDILISLRRETMSREKPIRILLYRENTWPGAWFLYGLPEVGYTTNDGLKASYDVVFTSYKDPEFRHLGYQEYNVPFRWWWVPDYQQMGPKEFFQYLFQRTPWNSAGSMSITIYYKEEIKPVLGI
ncbi:MAG: TIGR03663 family protein [Bdellovibrio sp.]|nr:TIGR03663 family protein [Bdellovibrio sp.]